jgi:muconolactone D-isomerase
VLFAVTMDVSLPSDLDPGVRADTLAREKAYSQDLQRQGKWPHIWRIVGQYANLSIFDVADSEELHEILWNLPLFPYMTIQVTPLTRHPSDIRGPMPSG